MKTEAKDTKRAALDAIMADMKTGLENEIGDNGDGDKMSLVADELDFIKIELKGDEIEEYESELFGQIVWNKTQKTIKVRDVVLTEFELSNLKVKVGEIDMEIMSRFGAKPVQVEIRWDEPEKRKISKQI